MLELSQNAREELEAYFEDKEEKSPIRVFLANSCSGMRLSLALDEADDDDQSFDVDGFTFIVSKDLLELTGNINIDLGPFGFDIMTEIPLELESAGGCSGCPSAGSCGV
ncbi:MAG: IscA/HesB family protein [Desulfovibrionaceae bacterium]|nr:IscA/HesB family protein [Desulfovibrionaceae bacterium]